MIDYDIMIHFLSGFRHNGRTGFVLGWGAKDIGFGELTFVSSADLDEHGFPTQTEWKCDNECMGRDFVKAVLAKLGDIVVLKHEKEKGKEINL